jgi:hypothetical protein
MGCWNGTCAVSNLHVKYGEDVAVFLLLKNAREGSFCYGNALYDVCPLPFYGKYNDYGAVEECHGNGLSYVMEALKGQLYEFGQGPNEYHDCEVRADSLTIEKLFDADHEGRLAVQQSSYVHDGDEYDRRELEKKRDSTKGLTPSQEFELARLINKIKGVDTFRRVTHVIIHGKVFRAIMDDWYIESYVGSGKGDKGYGNNYKNIYFADIKASIPEYIRRIKEATEKKIKARSDLETADKDDKELMNRLYTVLVSQVFEWDDQCLAGAWMRSFKDNSDNAWGLIEVHEWVKQLAEEEAWDELEKFATEALTGAWINCFMMHTRKIWTKQTGFGSQNEEPGGYILLADTVKEILKAEQQECEEDEDDE